MKKICSNLQGKDNAPPPPPQWIEAKDALGNQAEHALASLASMMLESPSFIVQFTHAYKIWPLFSPMVLPHFKHSRFKDDQHCSHRIAEVLDPDGKISPAQISNMLKRLGLAVAPRRKMCDADAEGPLARKPKDLFIQ
ncbi:hypothetical protein JHK85_012541 [Glycine max]|nr:hypothetical protein JHK85_012541 [Glycine max]KAG5057212.1 hypothetical protein JHK86_012208 [Glycine max]